ncbi:MAG: hypothetical protein ACI9XO_003166 [Paraglaciecola sp.]|jgi:hypothetical protein
MGLIIIPVFLITSIIVVISLIMTIKLKQNQALNIATILLGIVMSFCIYSGIGISYYLEENVWGLSPFFRIPIWMCCIPGIIGFILIKSKNDFINTLGKSTLIKCRFFWSFDDNFL